MSILVRDQQRALEFYRDQLGFVFAFLAFVCLRAGRITPVDKQKRLAEPGPPQSKGLKRSASDARIISACQTNTSEMMYQDPNASADYFNCRRLPDNFIGQDGYLYMACEPLQKFGLEVKCDCVQSGS